MASNSIDWLIGKLLDNGYGVPKEWREEAQAMYKVETEITEDTSDGYHTFKTLYEIRKAYNVALFNDWAEQETLRPIKPMEKGFYWGYVPKYRVHKSRKHYDGEFPFGKDNWFIVCAELPSGQISNHYPIEDWDLFRVPETPKALFPFDGHATDDVIHRLLTIPKSL